MTLNVIFVCKINDVLAERSATADEQALDELQALPAENKPKRRLMRISAIKTQKKHLNMRCFTIKWRRGRDSNSGWGRPHDGFQDRCIKPLCHLSNDLRFLKDFLLKRIKKVKSFFYIFQKNIYIPKLVKKTEFNILN